MVQNIHIHKKRLERGAGILALQHRPAHARGRLVGFHETLIAAALVQAPATFGWACRTPTFACWGNRGAAYPHGLLLTSPGMQRTLGVSAGRLRSRWSLQVRDFSGDWLQKWLRREGVGEVSEHETLVVYKGNGDASQANNSPVSAGAILDVLEIRGHALLLVFSASLCACRWGFPFSPRCWGLCWPLYPSFLILGNGPGSKRLRQRAIPYESLERLVKPFER